MVAVEGINLVVGGFSIYGSNERAAVIAAGSGLGAIYVALLNIGLWSGNAPNLSRRVSLVANGLFLSWLIIGLSARSGWLDWAFVGVAFVMAVSAGLLVRVEDQKRTNRLGFLGFLGLLGWLGKLPDLRPLLLLWLLFGLFGLFLVPARSRDRNKV